MSKYEGTQTEKNLLTAFAKESMARSEFSYFTDVAKKEGYDKLARLFNKTSENIKRSAQICYCELYGSGDTAENLNIAASNESFDWSNMYEGFAKTAKEEGFFLLSARFHAMAAARKRRADGYRGILESGKDIDDFAKKNIKVWECRRCGHIVFGESAWDICDECGENGTFFEILSESF